MGDDCLMITPRRLLLLLVGLLVVVVAWSAWTGWRTERDLRAAESAVERLRAAIEDGDDAARDTALNDLREAASAAKERTDGLWWTVMTRLPVFGDDASGVEALSASIDLVASDAVSPLVATVDSLDGLVADGRIDPARVAALAGPVQGAAMAMREAAALVSAQDSDGFVSALRTRYVDYVEQVENVAADFGAAERAVDVLPSMLGSEEPRDYLFVFQNNAEIRSTGGLPGSWARVHVEDGTVELREQGNGTAFTRDQDTADLTAEELAVYDRFPAVYFQDAGFIPDFSRAAELFEQFWRAKYPRTELDGVITLDPVGMSYLLEGIGTVEAGPVVLTSDGLVDELLNNTYLTVRDPVQQDLRFQAVARALFTATTSQLASPVDFATGVSRAIQEGRLMVAPFVAEDRSALEGTAVLGELTGDDGDTPHVDIGVNDTTGSKMSYYLRYRAEVRGRSCADDVQSLSGSVTLNQVISAAEARTLPDDVSGGGLYGIPVGSQLLTLRIYGPFGGSIDNVRIDGKRLDTEALEIDGRPVLTVSPIIETVEDVIVTWDMESGPGQSGAGEVGITPSVVPGNLDSTFASAC